MALSSSIEQTEEHKQGNIFMTISSRSEQTEEYKQCKIFLTLSTSEQTDEHRQGKIFTTLSSRSEQTEEHNVRFSWHCQHLNRLTSTDKVRFSWLCHQHLNRGTQGKILMMLSSTSEQTEEHKPVQYLMIAP